MTGEVSIGLAFLAGLASFLSPCVLSLVPAYVGYLSGRSAASMATDQKPNRWLTFSHGLAFVVGFSMVFIILGVAASALGGVLYSVRDWLTKIGGLVVVVFGVHMTGIIRIPFLEYDLRPQNKIDNQRSYFSSALMGIFFSAGWSPCVGPVLGMIMTMALNGGSIALGAFLLAFYSAGLAIPFLLAALGIGWVMRILQKYQKAMHYVEIGMGVVLIVVGGLLFFGLFEQFIRFPAFVDFGI